MLLHRLKTALPLIALMLLAFFLPGAIGRLFFSIFATAMLCLALYEIITLYKLQHPRRFLLPLLLLGFGLLVLAALDSSKIITLLLQMGGEIALLITYTLVVFCLSFRVGPTANSVREVNASLAAALYVCWPLCFFPKLYFLADSGPWLLFYLVLVTKMADVGAYFLGTITAKMPGGNHKIAKIVSPKKSWEGLLGGILASLLSSLFFFHYFQPKLNFIDIGGFGNLNISLTWAEAIALGIIAPIVGLLGDLAESVLKRAADVKDSGSLPGLGGILDTLDSLIPMAPLFYAWLLIRTALELLWQLQ